MDKRFLPTLISINVKDYSLYPGGLDFTYDFVKGLNLFFGGNGVGKTTFISLIKYGFIGLYSKKFDFRRTYKGKAIEKRVSLPSNFFSNRTDPTYGKNSNAQVTLTFKINKTQFAVKRSLTDDATLKEVIITENGAKNKLSGQTLAQPKYDRLSDEEKKGHLQFNYEKKVAEISNFHTFDDIILFVNKILYFEESHQTIMWDADDEEESIQNTLFSKYLIPRELDIKRDEALRKSKYYDSLSRHNSEDKRAIQKVIDSIQTKTNTNNNLKQVLQDISTLKQKIEKQKSKLKAIQKNRIELGNKRKILNNDRNFLLRDIGNLESQIGREEEKAYDLIWSTINPKYRAHFNNIRLNHSCPMCNKELENNFVTQVVENDDKCLYCKQDLITKSEKKTDVRKIEKDLKPLKIRQQQIDAEIVSIGDKFDDLDQEFRKHETELFEYETELRTLEHAIASKSDKSSENFELKAMMAEINRLEEKQRENQELSKKEEEKARKISKLMDEEIVNITNQLSRIFSDFAQSFLGVPCLLTYDDFEGNGKKFVPVINGIPRLSPNELSESQRFFIDHSYRMSLLHFFYSAPTFLVCETPDSSLDISYEHNAADVFIKFLELPNSLIITSNLNNSEFLEYIIKKTKKLDKKINYINLLEIGKKSTIQSNSVQLKTVINKINKQLHA